MCGCEGMGVLGVFKEGTMMEPCMSSGQHFLSFANDLTTPLPTPKTDP